MESEIILNELNDWLEGAIITVEALEEREIEGHNGMEVRRLSGKKEGLKCAKQKLESLTREFK